VKTQSLLVVAVAGVLLAAVYAQVPPSHTKASDYETKLAPVFREWERPDLPGGVVAVVEKGQVVFKKCYGLANVEYRVPNSSRTVYDVGQLAEPVTGMAVAMLEDQGKLSASDLVKKYIPELPSCADGLTVSNLVYHTSGLIDWLDLLPPAGWNEGDIITPDQIFKIVGRQNRLLIEPGSKFSYSRTDYVLLSEIVRRVTGRPLREWTWDHIFKPLAMTRTHFHDNHREVVEDRAYSINYHQREGYLKGADNLSAAGALSLFTTLDDFVKWMVNLEDPKIGSAKVRERMLQPGRLADGTEAGHSCGLVVDSFLGLKRVQKSGSWGGFRSAFHYYPEAAFAVAIFSNWDYGLYDPDSNAAGVARVCLEPLLEKPKKPEPRPEVKKAVPLSPEVLSQFEGEYRAGGRTYVNVFQEKGTLLFRAGGQAFRLVPAGEMEFSFEDPNIPVVLKFFRAPEGKVNRLTYRAGIQETTALKITRETLTPEQLKTYAGTYYNTDLNVRYEIAARDGRLVLSSLRTRDVVLTPENRRTFLGNSPGFQLVSFLIDEGGEVDGFVIDTDQLRHLVFRK
jgi:CubicO group peptidase (beta-lactamase class C family)